MLITRKKYKYSLKIISLLVLFSFFSNTIVQARPAGMNLAAQSVCNTGITGTHLQDKAEVKYWILCLGKAVLSLLHYVPGASSLRIESPGWCSAIRPAVAGDTGEASSKYSASASDNSQPVS